MLEFLYIHFCPRLSFHYLNKFLIAAPISYGMPSIALRMVAMDACAIKAYSNIWLRNGANWDEPKKQAPHFMLEEQLNHILK